MRRHSDRRPPGVGGPAALLLAVAAVLACAPSARAEQLDTQRKIYLELTTGYRLDGLSWNIAADPSGTLTPNILSELSWSNLQSCELGISLRARLANLMLRASGSFGWILAGDNRDSDYNGDNRTLEFSRSDNGAGGYLLEAAAGVGYPIALLHGRLELTPLLGLDYHAQSLRMFDGYQTIATDSLTPPVGPIAGLDSSYHAHWLAIRWAAELALALTSRLALDSALAAYTGPYWAEADWNLRPDFAHPVSFRHKADGWGLSFSGGLDWRPNPRWSFGLGVDTQLCRAGSGIDETYDVGGGSVRTRLNEVRWSSTAIQLRSSLRL
jgi:hypothetical protein